jgi:hypothetical protein
MADRTYVVSGDNLTVANAANTKLVFLNPSAGGAGVPGFEVLRAWVGQRGSVNSNQQGVAVGTKVTAFPTLTAATPAKTSLGLQTANLVGNTTGAAGTAGINSSVDGGGAETNVYPDNFNVITGHLFVPTQEERMQFMPGGTSGFFYRFTSTPASLVGWSFGVAYREIG